MNDSENLRDSIQDLAESISQSLGDTVVQHVFHLYEIKDIHTASISSLWDVFNELDAIAADLN